MARRRGDDARLGAALGRCRPRSMARLAVPGCARRQAVHRYAGRRRGYAVASGVGSRDRHLHRQRCCTSPSRLETGNIALTTSTPPSIPAARGRPAADGPLAVDAAGIAFANPVLLAAGTAGYGRELAGVASLAKLGGIVTKAVSVVPRAGAPSPRVAEFAGGMINAIGLANPGLESVRSEQLPWLLEHLASASTRVIVNVVGST